MTENERLIFEAGYRRSPNDDRSWYPGGPGLPCLDIGLHSVYVGNDGVMIGQYSDGQEMYTRRYNTVAEYLAACTAKSEGGQPAGYMNVWD
jgi:hypothetical protein